MSGKSNPHKVRHFNRHYFELKKHWKNYLFQSLFATLTMLIVLIFMTLHNEVVAASIGSSAFVVFAMPRSVPARARNVIGGQIIGMATGAFGHYLCTALPYPDIIFYSVAVGLSIFIMVVVDMEHPPASGTALGVAITSFSWTVGLGVIISVVFLSLVRHFFRRYIRDLV